MMPEPVAIKSEKRERQGAVRYPTSCSMVLLNRCCLACKMCHMWQSPVSPYELSVSEIKHFIAQAKDILEGTKEFIVTGGEPLLKEGIYDIIRYATDCGLKTIMPSNGYLITRDVAHNLAQAGLQEIFIALDSFTPEIHDFLRGRDGCLERVMQGIDYLAEYSESVRINIITVISQKNVNELVGHVHRIKQDSRISGVYFQAIAAPFFTCVGPDWFEQQEFSYLWPQNTEAVVSVIDEIIRLKRDAQYIVHNHAKQLELFKRYFRNPRQRVRQAGCYLGDYAINVDQDGNINLCCFDAPIGNIRTDDIRTVWFSDAVREIQDAMHHCNKNCHNMVNCFFKEDAE